MTRESLASAGDLLESAGKKAATSDSQETLTDLSDQLDELAKADRGPDHGRLARIEAKLDDVRAAEGEEVVTSIDEALSEIHAYRETLDGV